MTNSIQVTHQLLGHPQPWVSTLAYPESVNRGPGKLDSLTGGQSLSYCTAYHMAPALEGPPGQVVSQAPKLDLVILW